MSDLARRLFGDDVPAKPLALIVDLDDTLCVGFDRPVREAVAVLARVDRQAVAVHYVTARGEVSRAGTAKFLEDHRLPGWRNLHLCPTHAGTRAHKADRHAAIAREHRVIASIGDLDEEEGEAARRAGIPFVLVDRDNAAAAWVVLHGLIATAGGFRPADEAAGS